MFVGNGTSLEFAANRRLKGRRLCQSYVGAAFAAGVRSCQLHLCLCGSQREAVVDSVEECAVLGQLGRISRCLAMAVSPERVPCARILRARPGQPAGRHRRLFRFRSAKFISRMGAVLRLQTLVIRGLGTRRRSASG